MLDFIGIVFMCFSIVFSMLISLIMISKQSLEIAVYYLPLLFFIWGIFFYIGEMLLMKSIKKFNKTIKL